MSESKCSLNEGITFKHHSCSLLFSKSVGIFSIAQGLSTSMSYLYLSLTCKLHSYRTDYKHPAKSLFVLCFCVAKAFCFRVIIQNLFSSKKCFCISKPDQKYNTFLMTLVDWGKRKCLYLLRLLYTVHIIKGIGNNINNSEDFF